MTNATDFNGKSFFNLDHLKWLYFSPEGRANRLRYLGGVLLSVPLILGWLIVSSPVAFLLRAVGWSAIGGIPQVAGFIVWVITFIMLSIKRAHDRDHSGWYTLLTWIPFIGVIWQIELYFFAGSLGRNQYGEDPRA